MKLKTLSQAALAVALLAAMMPPAWGQNVSKPTDAKVDPLDWPFWRGPHQNGVSFETGLVESWSPDGENVIWKNDKLGTRSTPIVMNGKIYTLARDNPATLEEGEKVVCADAATGEILWENRFNVFLSDVPDTRVGWSSVVGDPTTGKVYALGVCGLFQCIDGESGKTLWSHSLSEEYGLLTTYGGRTNFPILFDDLVIISGVLINWGDHAKPAHQYLAFEKGTGTVVWRTSTRPLPEDTTFSSPTIKVIEGQAQMVFGGGDGTVYSLQPRTGKILWTYNFSRRGLNGSPLVVGKRVYIGQAEENIDDTTMGAIACIDATGTGDVTMTKEVWRVKEMGMDRSTPVLINGKLYCALNSGALMTLDAETGKTLDRTKLGTVMRPSLLYADGKLYVAEDNGRWYIFGVQEDGELDRLQRDHLQIGIHASPIVSHGRLYVTTVDAMYCIGKKDAKTGTVEAAAEEQETPVEQDSKVAQIQIVPCELLTGPGGDQQFSVRTYNAIGQYLGEAKDVAYSVEGAPGAKIGKDGTFTASDAASHRAATVTAKLGNLTSDARVRVVPELPWKFDFEQNQIPVTWIGARYRHQTREVDGNIVMVKVTTIPKGTRSQGWMGPDDMHDYTIQADVLGREVDGKMPDIGLIGQRYRLEMMGEHQILKLYSWVSHEKKYVDVPFEWKPDTWYTLKLRCSTSEQEGKPVAIYQGKVWPRGTAEPKEWNIEYTNETPDLQGSPGLFGNAKDAEIYYDNIQVVPNG